MASAHLQWAMNYPAAFLVSHKKKMKQFIFVPARSVSFLSDADTTNNIFKSLK